MVWMHMAQSLALIPEDPSDIGWPETLPLELAMGDIPPKEVFEAYGLGKSDYIRLTSNPYFTQAVQDAIDVLKKEGASFKVRAKAQSAELIKRSFAMAHASFEDVPPSVQADLIKFTIRAAGLDESMAQKGQANLGGQVNFQIVMNLGD